MGENTISVVVPIYNAAPYLSDCLESIINQSYQDLEVFLIDDGSTDESSRICKEYVERDERITYYRQKNAGQSAARNNGMRRATGKYLAFIDSDDWWDDDILDTLFSALKRYDAQLVMCQVRHEGFPETLDPELTDEHVCSGEELISNVLLSRRGFSATVNHTLFLTDLARSIAMLEGHIFEDLDYLVRLGVSIERAVSLPCRKYHYRFREGNSSSRALPLRFQDLNAVNQSICAHLEATGGRHLDELDQRYITNAINHLALIAAKQDGEIFAELRREVLSRKWRPDMQSQAIRYQYGAMKLGRLPFRIISVLYGVYRKARYAMGVPYNA